MPCITCENGAVICGPGVTQAECSDFRGVEMLDADGEGKCPDGWCFDRKCTQDGQAYSIWRPTKGSCLQQAYTPWRAWHEKKCGC
jgi:hypothetical protein